MTNTNMLNIITKSYTPTLGDGTNNFTLTTASCTYYLISSFVIVNMRVVWSSIGSATGGLRLALPATVGTSTQRASCTIGFANGVGFTGNTLTATASSLTQYATFYGISTSGVVTQVNASACASTGEIHLHAAYGLN